MIRNPSGKLTFRALVMAVLLLLGIGFVVWQSPRFAYAGHTPFATPVARAWLTVCLCLLCLSAWGVAALTRRIARVRITWDSAPAAPPPVEVDEDRPAAIALRRLNGIFRSVRRLLRGDGPLWRLGRHSLYRLPWYLLLGGERSGKTSLMSSSRLEFAQLDGEAAPRPGDPCRFWLGDQAVLIEAAGPLAFAGTQSGTQAGTQAGTQPGMQPGMQAEMPAEMPADMAYPLWRRLLKLLRRARRRCPVNGVIVTISTMELLAGDEGRAARARVLRSRLREMQRFFRVQFPVYVVVTHCDRLAGFEAFFQHLDRAAADQAWGVTFAGRARQPEDASLTEFPREFAALAQRLHDRMVPLVAAGGDAARAGKVYGFPAQFEALGEPLCTFLSGVFSGSPYAPTAWLRGVYFTSAAQDEEAVPRRASALAALVQQGGQTSAPRSLAGTQGYFIARLLRNVVFPEYGLAGGSPAFHRRGRLLRGLIGAAVLAVFAGAAGALYVAYLRNQALIAGVDGDTARLASLAATAEKGAMPAQPAAILALLATARRPVPPSSQSAWSDVLLRRVGLYQGDMLANAAHATYGALLRQTLLPFVQDRARQAMMDTHGDDMARFRALRAYLMMGDSAHYDAASVLAWISQDLRQLPLTDAQREDLRAHVQALFDMPAVAGHGSIDAALVARVRAELAAGPQADRLYAALLSELHAAMPDSLSVAQLAGVDAPLVLRRASGAPLSEGVPGEYTLAGYSRYLALRDTLIRNAEQDQWVLGEPGTPQAGEARLRAELDQDYFSHYIAAWDALLEDVRAGDISADAQTAASDMHLLAAPDSPLRQFLQGAAAQTTLAAVPDPATAPSTNATSSSTTLVDQHFDALHQIFRGRDGTAMPFADIQAKMGAAAVYLDAVDAARLRGMPPPSDEAIQSLQDVAEGQPAPLGNVLRGLASGGRVLASGDVRQRLDELWRSNVAPFCHAALDGRYPVDPRSRQDMTQDDFSHLLGPGGLIDAFFQANLQPYADMTTRPWRWRPDAARLRLSRAALQAFEDAASIRQAFFPDGQKAMSIRFQLLPLSLDPYFTRFSLTLGNQTLEYAHGPARPVAFLWPDSGAAPSARIDYEPAGDDGRSGIGVGGPWSLFRLIEMGTLEPVRADRYTLTFMLSGKPVSLELDAGSVINPFALTALHRFRCLDNLGVASPAGTRPASQGTAIAPSKKPAM